MIRARRLLAVWLGFAVPLSAAEKWEPKPNPLMTKWAADVDPEHPLPEYPRPQLVREHWQNLNGLWDYAITPKDQETPPEKWDGRILVPFPVESSLSGVKKFVGPDNVLWYRRPLAISQETPWKGKRILLHFGAVDWDTTVRVNGHEVGKHRGGYDPFSFDITDALKDKTEHELVVRVYDPSDAGYQPRGKQVQKPEGIWYTPTTGIWQTVWLEPVHQSHFHQVSVTSGSTRETLKVVASLDPDHDKIHVELLDGEKIIQNYEIQDQIKNTGFHPKKWIIEEEVTINNAKLWSPESPYLYGVRATIQRDGTIVDEVISYFALRIIHITKDDHGVARIFLNDKPYFQIGPLDQGFWPDGLYTAPTDEALKSDIEMTKKYGFNLIRKHVKVEPARWYYWCDKLGVLVWQDMPSGDKSPPWDPFGKHNGEEITRSKESAENYRTEWKHIIDALRPFPCIVMWVPFNEAWGQFDTVAVSQWTKEYDPSRLVNCASGGNDFPVGDVVDVHRYPGPFAPKPEEHRAAVLGEFGGLGLPIEGHTWLDKGNWGYRSFTNQEALIEAYLDLMDRLHPMISQDGLSAAIYTQTTDVEVEVNGLMTYDRKIQKLPVEVLAEAHRRLSEPPQKFVTLVPTSEKEPQTWRYTVEKPGEKWFTRQFDDSGWKSGPGGFGERSTPGSVVKTEWKSPDIWLRRMFTLDELPKGEVRLRMHHDEDAEVYLNGELIKQVIGYTTDYVTYRLPESAKKALKAGENTLAVHCRQTGGGQYIDLGLIVAE